MTGNYVVDIPQIEPSILRVPACYRRLKPEAYSPAVVSFGPYHHGTGDHLQQMEVHKERVLEGYFGGEFGNSINESDVEEAVRNQLPELMRCYAGFERISQGEAEYVRFLINRHRVDEFAILTTATANEESCEEFAHHVAMMGAEEFARRLLKDINIDEFSRFMVWGEDISRHMVIQKTEYWDRVKVKDADIQRLLKRHNVQNLFSIIIKDSLQECTHRSQPQEFVCCMMKKCVEKFTCCLVKSGWKAFTRMLVRDGFFLISLLVAAAKQVPCDANGGGSRHASAGDGACSDVNDSIFCFVRLLELPDDDAVFGVKSVIYIWPYIKRDLLLIENQIPMRLLNTLLAVVTLQQPPNVDQLHMHMLRLLDRHFYKKGNVLNIGGRLVPHMLGLYKASKILGEDRRRPGHNFDPETAKNIFLKGVNISQNGSTSCFDDFSYVKRHWLCELFSTTATMYIPNIMLNDITEYVLLNLMAFETLYRGTDNDVTLYVTFMARLLRKPLHVKMLQTWYKVNITDAWSKQEVVDFFKRASRGVPGTKPKICEKRGLMRPYSWRLWLWPAIIFRFMTLLLIEDRGRWFGYVALIVAVISFWCTFSTRRF